jgi:hypothetical protein
MDTDFCPQGKEKLVARYVKCLSPGMDYVKEQWAGNAIKSELFLKLYIKYKVPNISGENVNILGGDSIGHF